MNDIWYLLSLNFFCSKEIPFVHTSKKLRKLNWMTEASRTINTTGNVALECCLPSIIHESGKSIDLRRSRIWGETWKWRAGSHKIYTLCLVLKLSSNRWRTCGQFLSPVKSTLHTYFWNWILKGGESVEIFCELVFSLTSYRGWGAAGRILFCLF